MTALSGAASGAAAGSSFGPWGAAIGGVIGLLGARSQNKQAEKAQQYAEAQRQETLRYINEMVAKSQGQLQQGYGLAQQDRQAGLDYAMPMLQESFQPMMDSYRQGNMMAQNTLLGGLPAYRDALMGKQTDYSGMQGQLPQIDYSALSGMWGRPTPTMTAMPQQQASVKPPGYNGPMY